MHVLDFSHVRITMLAQAYLDCNYLTSVIDSYSNISLKDSKHMLTVSVTLCTFTA